MTVSHLLPSKFNSNLYSHRELVSQKLTLLVMFRIRSEDILCTPDDVRYCDILLQTEHYKFKNLISMIETQEKDVYTYGGKFADGFDGSDN